MAKAPKPGAQRQRTERSNAQQAVHLTVDGTEYVLHLPLPTGETRALRAATGLRLDDFLGIRNGRPVGDKDSVAVVLWLARRQAGERALRIEDVELFVDDVFDGITSAEQLAARVQMDIVGGDTEDDDPEA